ncbi:MAG: hypothetical protein JSS68_11195 [Actinobacteria bacterium]|nr:hypothetical protein [Actinomycetota bacterium]
MTSLSTLLDERNLHRLAGGRSYERGLDYAAAGQVSRLTRGEASVEAGVQGTHSYRVELWVEDGELRGRCDCPMGAGGAFCKHCVATGLAALEAGKGAPRSISLDEVRDHLGSLKKKDLIELLIAEAGEDDRLLDRLRLRVATSGDGVDLASFRDAIDRAVDPGGFIGYAEAYDYARTVEATIASLRDVVLAGHAVEGVELIEYCCAAIERAGDRIDDSDGHLGVAFDSLQRLHREACEQADFVPAQLAERLFEQMMATDYELFYDAADVYAPLLGASGRRRYAELVQAEWERLPALRPQDDRLARSPFSILGGDDDEHSESSRRFRITYVMELLASQSDDPDELVAVLSCDLSSPYSFLRIAEVYDGAGRDDDAIEWAERGIEAFPGGDSRLVEFLAAARRGRGEHARAAELIWSLYEAHPGLGYLEMLKPYAEEAGTWADVRRRALDLLRERIAAAQDERRVRGYGWSHRDATELVRVRLWEGDLDAALADAREGGCQQDVWLALAEALEEGEPWEAMIIYREQVEPTIERKRKADYRAATDMLAKVRNLMERTGHGDEFPVYLEGVRERHRRKRNLMKLLPELEAASR